MAKAKVRRTRRKPRARPSAARRRSPRASQPKRTPPARMEDTVRENESEDQAGAYGDGLGETDLIQP